MTVCRISRAKSIDVEQLFSVSAPALTEGDAGNKSFGFVVSASRSFPYDVSFDYTTRQRSGVDAATSGSDYEETITTGTLSAGQTQVTVNVPVTGDTDIENDELFDVRFSNFRRSS